MKYPRFNHKQLDDINKKKFARIYGSLITSIDFDKNENQLRLTKKDIELLAWNGATHLLTIL